MRCSQMLLNIIEYPHTHPHGVCRDIQSDIPDIAQCPRHTFANFADRLIHTDPDLVEGHGDMTASLH